jgi:hypothetical protein
MHALADRKSHLVGCGWFWTWAIVGLGFGLGISTVGTFTVPLALIAVFFLTRRGPVRGAFGALTGAGAVFLYIAYVQRQGPGTTCYTTATGGGCDEHLNPLPWLVIGLVLFVAGVVLHARRS